MHSIRRHLVWLVVAVVGAFALGTVALSRGEAVNALWMVVAAICTYLIAYRYYSLFIADKVLGLDGNRKTPAHRHNDGLDYVPTDKNVLFGHHFAAIAGAGPLVGPVLAAQMGYLPGLLWILAGVVFAGAVQDFIVLFISTRRDGRSLGDLVKQEMGAVPGMIALFGTFMIMIIILAVLALIVVKALAESPWGTFTVAATIPVALFMGVYLRYIRPGRIGEVSRDRLRAADARPSSAARRCSQNPDWAPLFTFDGKALTWMLIGYGFIAAVPAGVAAAGAARLPVDLPEDRHDHRAGHRHRVRRARRCRCRPSRSSRRATARCGRATCSRSCSSPSPAARCRASTR